MIENSLTWPKSFGEYLNTAVNPLNPYNHGRPFYVYGLFPVVVTKFVGQVVGKTGYDGVYLVGRALSAIMDMLCVVLVFLIGRRLYDTRVGLVAALLLSLSVADIQQSHYFTVDTCTTLFVTLALYSAVRVAQGEGFGSVLMLGAAFGLAVAAKISVLTFILVICLAFTLRAAARWKRGRLQGSRVAVDFHGRWGGARVVDARRTKEIALIGWPQDTQVLAHGIRNLRVVVPILMRRRVLGKVKVSTLIACDQYQYHRDRYGEPAAPVECRARV